MPANAEAEATTAQFTLSNAADVPIVATAVCAIVLSARMPAAFSHSFVNTFLIKPLLPVVLI
jgi:hypothetical protein